MSPTTPALLIIDDSQLMLKVLSQKLKPPAYRVFTATRIAKAAELLESTTIDIVITDKMLPEGDGLDIIRLVRENYANTGIIMITGYATMQGAIEAVKQGADEYLEKPIKDDELFAAIERVLKKINRSRLTTDEPAQCNGSRHGIIGESSAMQKVLGAVPKVAAIPATVLLTGASGTGKELIARAIHYQSPRAGGPFVAVNCSAIPETLLESELFGSLKGAYTGATESRDGYFRAAEGGTLFLDEISTTSLPLQAKLLRAVQEKEISRIGESTPQPVNVKIITATNRNLYDMVQKKLFREDLYYRLNVLTIHLPPLAERGDDVLLLIRHFSCRYAEEFARPVPSFSDEALQALAHYAWPGNIRELENLIQHLVALLDSSAIDITDLPPHMRFHLSPKHALKPLAAVEQEHIQHVLNSVGGNKTKAAAILGIDRKTLRKKLKS